MCKNKGVRKSFLLPLSLSLSLSAHKQIIQLLIRTDRWMDEQRSKSGIPVYVSLSCVREDSCRTRDEGSLSNYVYVFHVQRREKKKSGNLSNHIQREHHTRYSVCVASEKKHQQQMEKKKVHEMQKGRASYSHETAQRYNATE